MSSPLGSSTNNGANRRRSLGTVCLYPSSYLRPETGELRKGSLSSDGQTIYTQDGDTFATVLDWVHAEKCRFADAQNEEENEENEENEREY